MIFLLYKLELKQKYLICSYIYPVAQLFECQKSIQIYNDVFALILTSCVINYRVKGISILCIHSINQVLLLVQVILTFTRFTVKTLNFIFVSNLIIEQVGAFYP